MTLYLAAVNRYAERFVLGSNEWRLSHSDTNKSCSRSLAASRLPRRLLICKYKDSEYLSSIKESAFRLSFVNAAINCTSITGLSEAIGYLSMGSTLAKVKFNVSQSYRHKKKSLLN